MTSFILGNLEMKILSRLRVQAFALPPTKDSGFVSTLSKMYKDKANIIAGNTYDTLADLISKEYSAGIIEVATFLNSSYGKKIVSDLFLRNILEGKLDIEALYGYVKAPYMKNLFNKFMDEFRGK